MDHDKVIRGLSAETLATQLVLVNVLEKLRDISPSMTGAITKAFDDAANTAEQVAIQLGKSAAPELTVKALGIIEEMRAVVLGDQGEPKHGV